MSFLVSIADNAILYLAPDRTDSNVSQGQGPGKENVIPEETEEEIDAEGMAYKSQLPGGCGCGWGIVLCGMVKR